MYDKRTLIRAVGIACDAVYKEGGAHLYTRAYINQFLSCVLIPSYHFERKFRKRLACKPRRGETLGVNTVSAFNGYIKMVLKWYSGAGEEHERIFHEKDHIRRMNSPL